MGLFDNTMSALGKALDLHLKRQSVLSSNLANSETPNFRAREVDFAGELLRATGQEQKPLVMTNPKHMGLYDNSGDHIVFDNSGAVGADGNNVDLDITVGKISEASRAYSSAANLLGIKFRMLRQIATGRGV